MHRIKAKLFVDIASVAIVLRNSYRSARLPIEFIFMEEIGKTMINVRVYMDREGIYFLVVG